MNRPKPLPAKAMILAAGRGERLRPLTDKTPKPMVDVHGQPLLAHQIEWLRQAGISELVINLHHLGEQIEAHFAAGEEFGVRIRYSREETLLETGGGIVNALPLLGDAPFLLLNGDIFTDFPFASITPLPDWADIHLVVTPTPAYRETGDFEYADGRITARGSSYVYCGIAILRPEIFASDRAEPFSLRDRFFAAIDAGTLSAQVWNDYWIDIGSQAQLDAVNARMAIQ
jgi:MurNAc alpha-1-phosphate uridylyltransferase